MDTLAFILSTFGTVCICIPPLLKGKNMKLTLLLVFLANAFVAASYLLTGAFNGVVSCSLGAAQAIINYFFERKGKALPYWLIGIYAVAFTIVNVLVFSKISDILVFFAGVTFTMSVCQKNGRSYRLWTLGNAGCWMVYDFINVSYGPLLTHIIQTSIVVCGIVVHDLKKNKKAAQ